MADIMTPALGESVSEATVARWTKKVGDTVKRDEVLVELDTDKVSLEVSSPSDGVLESIDAAEGATITPGTVLGKIGGAGAQPAESKKPAQSAAAPPGDGPTNTPTGEPKPPLPDMTAMTCLMPFCSAMPRGTPFAASDGAGGAPSGSLPVSAKTLSSLMRSSSFTRPAPCPAAACAIVSLLLIAQEAQPSV